MMNKRILAGFAIASTAVAVFMILHFAHRPGPHMDDPMHVVEFKQWMMEHGKHYESEEEFWKRLDVFMHNKKRIEEINHSNGHHDHHFHHHHGHWHHFVHKKLGHVMAWIMNSPPPKTSSVYRLAINKFADLTSEEFQQSHMGCLNSKAPKPKSSLGIHTWDGKDLPESIDWSSEGAVTPPKNQGQCGSCWSFSTTGSIEGHWEVATGQLVSLSEQQFVDCSAKYGNMGCNGGLMDAAFEFAEVNALCTEDEYPYHAKQAKCVQASQHCDGIPKGGVTGFKDVGHHEKDLEDALTLGPVSIAIEADKEVFQFYHDGVLTKKCGEKLDHGVLAVGYGVEDGIEYWKIKNSWGPDWGKNGYIKVQRGAADKDNNCGILLGASFPIVKKPEELRAQSQLKGSKAKIEELKLIPEFMAPVQQHYEKPPCGADEVQAHVQGAGGASLCAPHCQGMKCPPPTDDVKASPQCVLTDQSGNRYCALVCKGHHECGNQGGKCAIQHRMHMGVCVYPDSEHASDAKVLRHITEPETKILA